MKPTEPDIQYCLKHKEDIARWLEERGGWQEFDFAAIDGAVFGVGRKTDGGTLFYNPETDLWYEKAWFDSIPVWLPGVGDVLEMLDERRIETVYLARTKATIPRLKGKFFQASTMGPGDKYYGETRLIVLMELLKAVGNE